MTDKKQEVRDIPVERGVITGNLIGAAMLALLSWMGYNLEYIKDVLGELKSTTAVNTSNIQHNTNAIDKINYKLRDHVNDHDIHTHRQ